ncbi:transposase [Streptomyces mirabilis]|nr:transposase [Streptomyces mirabilis]
MHHLVRQLWEIAPDTGRGRPWALPFADRVLLIVLAYRTNLTMQQLGTLFGVSHAAAHRVVARLAQPLAELLGPPPTDRRELWIVDGTLIPVHDQKRTAKSKNYRRSVNVQIVCRARDRRVVAVAEAWPGNRNDVVVFRETLGRTLPDHPGLSGDGGYRGSDRIRTPRRGTNGRIVKDWNYRRFRKRRAVAEHGGGGVRCARAGEMHARTGAGARAAGGPAPGGGCVSLRGLGGIRTRGGLGRADQGPGAGMAPGSGSRPRPVRGSRSRGGAGVTPSRESILLRTGHPLGVAVSARGGGARSPGHLAPLPGARPAGPAGAGHPHRGPNTRAGGGRPLAGGRRPGSRASSGRELCEAGGGFGGAGMEAISVATLRAASR